MVHAIIGVIEINKIFLVEFHACRFQVHGEACMGFLRHGHQDIGLGEIGIKDGLVGDNQLRAARTAPGLRAETLRQGSEPAVMDGRGFTDHHARQDHALPAKTRDADSFARSSGSSQSHPAYWSLRVCRSC